MAMLTVDEVLGRILETIGPPEAVTVALPEAFGLVLAEEVIASEDLPLFANSAMDGYAVASADTVGASPQALRSLRVVGELPAGSWPEVRLARGEAIRIMTGAPLPSGADAIVRVEWTERASNGRVLISQAVSPGFDVRPAGEDVRRGETILHRGCLLRPAEIGMLAALGRADAQVFRRPTVAVVTTGDELVEPGLPLPPGRIWNSNRYSLTAQVAWCGARIGPVMHVSDKPEAVERGLRQCAQADLIVTSGGVSVGDFDLVTDALAHIGQIKLWKV